jgi:hypothetical protein
MCRSDCLKSIPSRVEAIERRRNCVRSIYQFNSCDLQANMEAQTNDARQAPRFIYHHALVRRNARRFSDARRRRGEPGKSVNPPRLRRQFVAPGIECLKKMGLSGAVGECVGFSALIGCVQTAPEARTAGLAS